LLSASVSRPGTQDADELSGFILEAWAEAGTDALGWTGGTERSIKQIASKEFLYSLLSSLDVAIFVARDAARKMVGFAICRRFDEGRVELAGMIVAQSSIGKRFGSMMFEKARRWAEDSQFKKMIVKTEAKNSRAISFYKSKGFVELSTNIEQVNDIQTELVTLELALTRA
jgi:GNAT superfamily N-acetyltransferase